MSSVHIPDSSRLCKRLGLTQQSLREMGPEWSSRSPWLSGTQSSSITPIPNAAFVDPRNNHIKPRPSAVQLRVHTKVPKGRTCSSGERAGLPAARGGHVCSYGLSRADTWGTGSVHGSGTPTDCTVNGGALRARSFYYCSISST